MSNKLYDILKYVAQIILPACATLYFALAGIWNLPYREEVVGTITAINTFLGVILGISSANYKRNEALNVISDTEEVYEEEGDE